MLFYVERSSTELRLERNVSSLELSLSSQMSASLAFLESDQWLYETIKTEAEMPVV
jgi:hypothetical protein